MLLVYVEDHPGAIAVGGIGRRHRRCKEDDGHRFHRNCRYPSGLPNQEGDHNLRHLLITSLQLAGRLVREERHAQIDWATTSGSCACLHHVDGWERKHTYLEW